LLCSDDIVIYVETELRLQSQLDDLETSLEGSGLKFNQAKWRTFRLKADRISNKWTINPKTFLRREVELVPTITVESFHKYLGIKIRKFAFYK